MTDHGFRGSPDAVPTDPSQSQVASSVARAY